LLQKSFEMDEGFGKGFDKSVDKEASSKKPGGSGDSDGITQQEPQIDAIEFVSF